LQRLQICRIARIAQAIAKNNYGTKGLRLNGTCRMPERRQ